MPASHSRISAAGGIRTTHQEAATLAPSTRSSISSSRAEYRDRVLDRSWIRFLAPFRRAERHRGPRAGRLHPETAVCRSAVAVSQVCATPAKGVTFIQPPDNRILWITLDNLFGYLACQ